MNRSNNSSHETDDSASDGDEWIVKTLALLRGAQNIQFMTVVLASKYFLTCHDKNGNRTPSQSGFGWTMEKLQTPGQSLKMFRMDPHLFYQLHDLLARSYVFESSVHINSIESLAIFPTCVWPRYVEQCY